ncbi:lysosomal-trafficking regulator-like [Ostrinia furnacalis]|uniref:lysosomal-trafficking regulator-like n=1 Tax=Ostrinia furnacalis TaxID=93504 RepID=UPI00103E99CF|nr:lysosomal-trafficking regulator-like [Ostrinia furnacalis]
MYSVEVFGSRVSGGGSLGGAGGAPEAVGVAWAGAALPSRHEGLAPALHALGGPEVLLYLYARVVELDGSPTEQAAALRLLLRAAGLDARLHAAALAPPTLDMLLVVLASPKCHVGHHLLRVSVAYSCSRRRAGRAPARRPHSTCCSSCSPAPSAT